MSVELVSIGNYDFSAFNLSSNEEIIISQIIKFDISSYLITKNSQTDTIEFFMNSTQMSQEKALFIFSHIFDLLEKEFKDFHKDNFCISILGHLFQFTRSIDLKNSLSITWSIQIDNLNNIKQELFDFFHKSVFYNYLKNKLKEKNISEPIKKI